MILFLFFAMIVLSELAERFYTSNTVGDQLNFHLHYNQSRSVALIWLSNSTPRRLISPAWTGSRAHWLLQPEIETCKIDWAAFFQTSCGATGEMQCCHLISGLGSVLHNGCDAIRRNEIIFFCVFNCVPSMTNDYWWFSIKRLSERNLHCSWSLSENSVASLLLSFDCIDLVKLKLQGEEKVVVEIIPQGWRLM